jgi:hypothetical protein
MPPAPPNAEEAGAAPDVGVSVDALAADGARPSPCKSRIYIIMSIKIAAAELYLFSALSFIRCRFLEERNPGAHHLFRDMKCHERLLRISLRQPPQQFLFRHIQEMNFAACAKLPGSRTIVFSFFPRPKAEIKDHIRPQYKRPAGHLPKQGFNERMPGVMRWVICILTEETQLPFIRREAQR